jgi:capsular polysaccharide biosynthesis protein
MAERVHTVELRSYAKILWRRIWVIALVVGLVTIVVAYQYLKSGPTVTSKTYQGMVSIRIGLSPDSPIQDSAEYARITGNLADELVNGPTLTNPRFNADVIQQIKDSQNVVAERFGDNANLGNITAEKLPDSYKATHIYNLVTITVDWSTEAGAWAIAHAVGRACERNLSSYLNYAVPGPDGQNANQAGNLAATAKVTSELDTPSTSGGNIIVHRKNTTLLIIFLVGLIIAVALAFLVEFLDDRIHEPHDITDALHLPIYGEVPRAPSPAQTRSQGPADPVSTQKTITRTA